jgi:glycosyltransferase involved in cell wall biosynthesis
LTTLLSASQCLGAEARFAIGAKSCNEGPAASQPPFAASARLMKTISVVTPCFNEEAGIRECIDTVASIFRKDLPGYRLEHIICDNCSTDSTPAILREVAASNPNVKVILNSRNFGILKNTFNGVVSATGDAVVLFLPADLQDPPQLIVEFVRLWESGYEIVYGVRAEREEGLPIRWARKAYYRMLSRLTYVDYPVDVGDFQLVDRKVHRAMMMVQDAQPFMRLMTFDAGFRSIGVSYTWQRRKHGVSRNRLRMMLEQGMNGIINYSGAPLRLGLLIGMGLSGLSLLYSFAVLILTVFGAIDPPKGLATIIIAIFFFGGVQLFFLGVLGEYILAIFNQVRRRPLVVERERLNFDPEPR